MPISALPPFRPNVEAMSYQYPIPGTPRVISPSPTPSETSGMQDSYFPPTTRSASRKERPNSPETISEERDGSGSDSDSSLEKRARTRSRSPVITTNSQIPNGGAAGSKRRRMSGLTPVAKSAPLINGHLPESQPNGHLSPYTYTSRLQKSWRDFSRSPSPLGLIPLHRHYRTLIHQHELPRKALHVSIGFLTIQFYRSGLQTTAITPWLLALFVPIASMDFVRHRSQSINRIYVKYLGALMRETEVDGYNGVIWYLLGAYIALKFYPKDVGVMSILLLSWCDTAASTFGRLYGRYTIRLRRGKSLAGTLAAWLVGLTTAIVFWGWLVPRVGAFHDDPEDAYMFAGRLSLPVPVTRLIGWKDGAGTITGATALGVMSVWTGFVASVSEFIDVMGWDDNLTIPTLSSLGIWGFLKVFGSS